MGTRQPVGWRDRRVPVTWAAIKAELDRCAQADRERAASGEQDVFLLGEGCPPPINWRDRYFK